MSMLYLRVIELFINDFCKKKILNTPLYDFFAVMILNCWESKAIGFAVAVPYFSTFVLNNIETRYDRKSFKQGSNDKSTQIGNFGTNYYYSDIPKNRKYLTRHLDSSGLENENQSILEQFPSANSEALNSSSKFVSIQYKDLESMRYKTANITMWIITKEDVPCGQLIWLFL